MRMQGTEFQRRVWASLCEIPYGETISYGELARWVGNPKASRAVGLANGRNPVAIIVPCHRVIGANGSSPATGEGSIVRCGYWSTRPRIAPVQDAKLNWIYKPRSPSAACAAPWPHMPCTPPPGGVEEEHRYTPGIGVR